MNNAAVHSQLADKEIVVSVVVERDDFPVESGLTCRVFAQKTEKCQFSPLALCFFCIWHSLVKGGGHWKLPASTSHQPLPHACPLRLPLAQTVRTVFILIHVSIIWFHFGLCFCDSVTVSCQLSGKVIV